MTKPAKTRSGKRTPAKKPGPKAELIQIDGDWTLAVKRAMSRGRPPAVTGKKKSRRKQNNT